MCPQSKRSGLICPGCNTTFYVKPSHADKRKYCSHQCRMNAVGAVDKKCAQCSKPISVPRDKLKDQNFCDHKCWADYRMARKEMHPRYKAGRYTDYNGYVRVYVEGRGWIFEHRLMAERGLGRQLAQSEKVHHVNGVKHDNRWPDNLEVVSQSQHMKLHAADNGWSRQHDRCIECSTTEVRHMAHGLCNNCYARMRTKRG